MVPSKYEIQNCTQKLSLAHLSGGHIRALVRNSNKESLAAAHAEASMKPYQKLPHIIVKNKLVNVLLIILSVLSVLAREWQEMRCNGFFLHLMQQRCLL